MRGKAWATRVCLIAGVLLAAGVKPVAAQRISIAPNIGVYIPTTELVKAASGKQFKQEISITLGGRLGIFFSQRLGVEFTGDYAPSSLKLTSAGFGDTTDANIFTGSGRVSFQAIPFTKPIAFLLTGGVGVINRSGAFYQDVEKRTDVGGTFGASLRFRLGRLLAPSVERRGLHLQAEGRYPGLCCDRREQDPERHPSVSGTGNPVSGTRSTGTVTGSPSEGLEGGRRLGLPANLPSRLVVAETQEPRVPEQSGRSPLGKSDLGH